MARKTVRVQCGIPPKLVIEVTGLTDDIPVSACKRESGLIMQGVPAHLLERLHTVTRITRLNEPPLVDIDMA